MYCIINICYKLRTKQKFSLTKILAYIAKLIYSTNLLYFLSIKLLSFKYRQEYLNFYRENQPLYFCLYFYCSSFIDLDR